MNKKLKKHVINLLKILVTTLAIWFVLSKINLHELVEQLKKANWIYLTIALFFFVVSKVVSALRLNIFFKNIELNIPNSQNFKLYILGMFYNLFLPGGIGGDAYKVYLLNKEKRHPVKKLAIAVLMDRINGVLAIMILTMGITAFMPLPAWICIISPMAAIVGFSIYKLLVSKFFGQFKQNVFSTTTYSVAVQILQCICVIFILMAMNISTNYFALIFVFMLSSIVAVLPFTIGGIGSREVVFVVCSQWLKIDSSIAVSVSLLFYIITALTSFCGIYYSFKTKNIFISENVWQ